MFFKQNKREGLHMNSIKFPEDYSDTNMGAVSLFRGTNMAAVTSCENQEYNNCACALAKHSIKGSELLFNL